MPEVTPETVASYQTSNKADKHVHNERAFVASFEEKYSAVVNMITTKCKIKVFIDCNYYNL